MKNNILFTAAVIVFLMMQSCSKKDKINDDKVEAALFQSSVMLNILDNEGLDLLNSKTTNYYSFDNMKLYYLVDGEKKEVYDSNMDLPRNIALLTDVKPYALGMALSYHVDSIIGEKDGFEVGRSITYLELNKGDIDTIVSEWKRKPGYFVVDKIWYNNAEEAYDVRNSSEPYKVIKDVN